MERIFAKPRIVISRCLGFAACRYNGDMITDPFIESMKPYSNFLPVCPELGCGLGVPRDPIRVVRTGGKYELIQPAADRDITPLMNSFISDYLQNLVSVDGFILKSGSPSCGLCDVKIYSGKNINSGTSPGGGFFGRAIMERYARIPMEDEHRLRNFRIRERFLKAVFSLARYQHNIVREGVWKKRKVYSRHCPGFHTNPGK